MDDPIITRHWSARHGFHRALLFPGWTMARAVAEFEAAFGRKPDAGAVRMVGDGVRSVKGSPLVGVVDREAAENRQK